MNASRCRWIIRSQTPSDPRCRLLTFAHAGAGAEVFRRWVDVMPEGVELCRVQLPGRGRRFSEPCFDTVHPLADAIVKILPPLLDRPWVVFGHSLGALIAYEVVCRVEHHGLRPPTHAVLSGHRAPGRALRRRALHDLPSDALWQGVAQMGGMVPELLADAELRALLQPALRADLAISERYQPQQRRPLSTPIIALRGLEDPEVSADDVAAWAECTAGEFRFEQHPGGHFGVYALRPLPAVVAEVLGRV